jgi:hypothetical protein
MAVYTAPLPWNNKDARTALASVSLFSPPRHSSRKGLRKLELITETTPASLCRGTENMPGISSCTQSQKFLETNTNVVVGVKSVRFLSQRQNI